MAKWKRTTIGQFLKEREGRYSPDDKKLAGLERLNKIDFSGEMHLSDKGSKTGMIIVEPGDLVISGINVAKGAIAVYQGEKPITATIHYSSYKFDKDQIDIEYFKRFVKSQVFVKALEVRGGIKTEIKPKHFLPLEIDLPGIDEQRKIVSFFRRIEDEIGDLGYEISAQFDYLVKLRQAVLQEAIEGNLTVEWRKQNPNLISGENHASSLLEKIKVEKGRLIKEGKIREVKPLPPITEGEKPFPLPDGWAWCRLGEICTKIGSGSTPKGSNYFEKGTPFFRSQNVHNEGLVYDDIKFISLNIHEQMKGTVVIADDLLLNITGGSLGRCALVPRDFNEGNVSQHVCIIRSVLLCKMFLHKIVLSPLFQGMVFGSTTGAGREGLPKYNLEQFVIPMPSRCEQEAIVECVNNLMKVIDDLEKQVASRKDQLKLLMQSVLREAFNSQGGIRA
jgi:type I restriction enzyme S subunit